METKRYKVLLICVIGWMALSSVLYIAVSAVLYRCKLKGAMITQTDADDNKRTFVVAGSGLSDSLYVNGNLVPEKAYIKEEKQYAVFQLSGEWGKKKA